MHDLGKGKQFIKQIKERTAVAAEKPVNRKERRAAKSIAKTGRMNLHDKPRGAR